MSEFFKSYEILSGDIETYSNTARDTGTIPNVYIYGKNYSSILKRVDSEIQYAASLITSIGNIKKHYEDVCARGITPGKCHKAIEACQAMISTLNAAKRKIESYPGPGGRNKINNTRIMRNIKSHRKNRVSKSHSRRHTRKLKSRKLKH